MELSGRIETQQHERVDFEDRQLAHARLATPQVKKKTMSGDSGPQSPVRPNSYRERRRLEHLALESQVNEKSSKGDLETFSSDSDSSEVDETKSERKGREAGDSSQLSSLQHYSKETVSPNSPHITALSTPEELDTSLEVEVKPAKPVNFAVKNYSLLEDGMELNLNQGDDFEKVPVRFGDMVFIKHVNVEGKTDGCMIAEGMVLETMSVSESVEAAMDSSRSLFRICPALSYDASTGLYELEAKLACGDSIPEEKIWEMREDAKHEYQQNKDRVEAVKKGISNGPILYTETHLQLQHVISGKFVTAKPHPYAKGSTHLQGAFGSPGSIFMVQPRYHFRADGDTVVYSDELSFESVPHVGYCLRLDRDESSISCLNMSGKPISLESSVPSKLDGWERFGKLAFGAQQRLHPLTTKGAWVLQRFSSVKNPNSVFNGTNEADAAILMRTGLYLFHLEEHAYLQINIGEQEDEEITRTRGGTIGNLFRKTPFLKPLHSTNIVDLRQGTLVPRSMWMLEPVENLEGGPAIAGRSYRIRHTHTQLYLTVDYSNIDLSEGTDELPQRIAVTTSSSPTIANVFIFQASRGKHMSSLSNVGTNLKNTGATSLRDEMKCWLEHTFFASNSRDVGGVPYRLQSLPGQGLYLSPALHNADVFVLRSAVPSEAILLLTCFDMVAIISRCANGHWNDEQSQEELRVVLATIKHLCINAEATNLRFDYDNFTYEQDDLLPNIQASSILPGNDMKYELLVFQNIAREAKLLDSLFYLAIQGLEKLQGNEVKGISERNMLKATENNIFQALESLVRGCRPSQADFIRKDYEPNSISRTTNLATARSRKSSKFRVRKATSFTTLSSSAGSPAGGSTRTAPPEVSPKQRWIDFVMQQAGKFSAAATLLIAIIENNEELLVEEKYGHYVDNSVVKKLVDLIRWHGPKPLFLDFFRHICKCKGEKIIPNQELLINNLYLKSSIRRELFIETVIPIKLSDSMFEWPEQTEVPSSEPMKVPPAFLGRGQYKNGFRPVYIKWFSNDSWRPNQSALYYSPRALHLVDRHGDFYERDVLLEKIAWILNPAQYFKRAMFKGLSKKIEEEFQYCRPISASVYEGKDLWWYTPDVQKSLNLGKVDALPDRAKEFFFRQLQLVQYYVLQLNLFADMAADRSYNAIHQLEEEFQYEILLTMIANEVLPDTIRAAATILVLRIYVDRFPHQPIQAPQCVHVLADVAPVSALKLKTTKKIVLPSYRVTADLIEAAVDEEKPQRMEFLRFGLKSKERTATSVKGVFACGDKFFLLQEYISRHLAQNKSQNPKETEKNRFTLAVVSLFTKLLQLGFYASYNRLTNAVDKAVGVLNGKFDDPGISLDSAQYAAQYRISDTLQRHRVETADDHIIVQCKQKIIQALIQVCNLRDDYRLKLLIAKVVEQHNSNASPSDGIGKTRTSSMLSNKCMKSNEDQLREITPLFIDGKPSEEFYQTFHAIFESSGDPNELNSMLQGHLLDLDVMSQSKLVPMCMDLMMYDSPQLFEGAFSLLHAQFTQRKPLIKAIKDVELLASAKIKTGRENFDLDQITIRVQHLRRLVESYEVWAVSNSFSEDNEASYTKFVEINKFLVRFCMHEKDSVILDADEIMQIGWPMDIRSQNILRSLGVHDCLLQAIRIPFHLYPAGRGREILQSTVNIAFETLAVFVLGNLKNQQIVADEFNDIVKLIENPQQTGSIEQILGPLVYKNALIIDSLDDSMLERLVALLARLPFSTVHLVTFYKNLVVYMSSASKRHAFTMAIIHHPLRPGCKMVHEDRPSSQIADITVESGTKNNISSSNINAVNLLSFVESCLAEQPLVEPFVVDQEVELNFRICSRVFELLSESLYLPHIWECCQKRGEDFQMMAKPHISYARTVRGLHPTITRANYLLDLMTSIDSLLHAHHSEQLASPVSHISSNSIPSIRRQVSVNNIDQRRKILREMLNASERLLTALYYFVDDEVRSDLFCQVKAWEALSYSIRNSFDIMDEAYDERHVKCTVMPMAHAFLLKSRGALSRFQSSGNQIPESIVQRKSQILKIAKQNLLPGHHGIAKDFAFMILNILDEEKELFNNLRNPQKVLLQNSVAPCKTSNEQNAVSPTSVMEVWRELVECCAVDERLMYLSQENGDKLRERIKKELGEQHGNFLEATDMKMLVFEIQRRGTRSFRHRPSCRDLVKKMVRHVIENFRSEVDSGFDTQYVNIEILYILVSMLDEWRPKNSNTSRYRSSYEDELREFKHMQEFMNDCGAMELAMFSISATDNTSVLIASLRLGINLLEFGNSKVQESLLKLCRRTEARYTHTTEVFFQTLQTHFIQAKECSRSGRPRPSGGKREYREEVEVIVPVLRFLQLAMEGHHLGMQNEIREQPFLHSDINLLDEALQLLGELAEPHHLREVNQMEASKRGRELQVFISVIEFLTETMQGPCRLNQKYFIEKSQALSAIKSILNFVVDNTVTAHALNNASKIVCHNEEDHTLFAGVCTLVHAAVEIGVNEHLSRIVINYFDSVVITEAIIYVYLQIHALGGIYSDGLENTQANACRSLYDFFALQKRDFDVTTRKKKLLFAGHDIYSFAKQLSVFEPSLLSTPANFPDDDLAMKAIIFLTEKVRSIEFIWSETGTIHSLYFLKPPEVEWLSGTSVQNLNDYIDVESLELLQKSFLGRAQELVDEMCCIHDLTRSYLFKLLSGNLSMLHAWSFGAVIFLNISYLFSVRGPGGSGSAAGDLFSTNEKNYKVRIPLGMRILFYMFLAIGWFGYLLCFVTKFCERYYLIATKLKRNRKHDRIEREKNVTGINLEKDTSTHERATYNVDEEEEEEECKNNIGDNDSKYSKNKRGWSPSHGRKCEKFNSVLPLSVTEISAAGISISENLRSKVAFDPTSQFPKVDLTPTVSKIYFTGVDSYHALNLEPIQSFIYLAFIVFLVALLHYLSYESTKGAGMWLTAGLLVLAIFFLLKLLDVFKNIEEGLLFEYCVLVEAITERDTLAYLLFCLFLGLHWLGNDFYLVSLCLLDAISMSSRLQNVLRAITVPFYDFISIFTLMLLVIFIFAAWGLYLFGEVIVYEDDALAWYPTQHGDSEGPAAMIEINQQNSLCQNLLMCWLEMLDEGLRSGDIVDATFDVLTMADGPAYYNRVIYGLVFFLVVGVILFDIVTGIVVDTFAQLREETDRKIAYHKSTAFISGLTRAEYEEFGLDFDQLREQDQLHWNYVYFICYLRLKNETEYNGVESMIQQQIDRQDISWLPKKKTCAMQAKGEEGSYDEKEMFKEEIIQSLSQKVDSLEHSLKTFITGSNSARIQSQYDPSIRRESTNGRTAIPNQSNYSHGGAANTRMVVFRALQGGNTRQNARN